MVYLVGCTGDFSFCHCHSLPYLACDTLFDAFQIWILIEGRDGRTPPQVHTMGQRSPQFSEEQPQGIPVLGSFVVPCDIAPPPHCAVLQNQIMESPTPECNDFYAGSEEGAEFDVERAGEEAGR